MKILFGTSGANGIGIAKAKVIEKNDPYEIDNVRANLQAELAKLNSAFQEAIAQIEELKEKATETLGKNTADIFLAHLFFVQDREFQEAIRNKILQENITAEEALKEVEKKVLANFHNLNNEYMKERIIDFQDIIERIMSHLKGKKMLSLEEIKEETIIVAKELTPSEALQLNPQYIKGIVTESVTEMSHTSMIVHSLHIPIVTGVKDACKQIKTDMLLLVNGQTNEVVTNPTEEMIASFNKQNNKSQLHVKQRTDYKTMTTDGHTVKITANIFTPIEMGSALQFGAEGIGLFRTEAMFLKSKKILSEEEQLQIYKKILQSFPNYSVTMRTLDIGGDKPLPYLQLPKEGNPFLGYRSIRVSLKEIDAFRTQIRALLRASIYGKLKLMFPLITTYEEWQKVKEILHEEKVKLQRKNIAISDEIEIGLMVETPATCICAEFFVEEIDFFSIGTNDLIQYTLAVDRLNDHVSYLYQPLNPAIIRFMKMVTDIAHKHGKTVSVCGEMARDPLAIPILVGLGIDELSINVPSLQTVKNEIKRYSLSTLQSLVQEVLQKKTSEEIENFIKRFFT